MHQAYDYKWRTHRICAARTEQLPDTVSGKDLSLEEISKGKPATLVMVICNHCPFVVLLKGEHATL